MEFKSPLARTVARELADDARTANSAIDVVDNQGMITLLGSATTARAAKIAQVIAAQCAGVISVAADLTIEPQQDEQTVLAA